MLSYWGADRRNVLANGAYGHWAGITPSEMPGLHMREVLGDDFYEQALPYIDGALGGAPQAYERVRGDADNVRRAHVTLSPDVVAGRVVGLVGLGIELPGRRDRLPPRHMSAGIDGAVIECLTDREREVLCYLPTDLSRTEIAARLYMSVNTAKTHLKTLYRKLGVQSRHEAIARGMAAGLLGDTSPGGRTARADLRVLAREHPGAPPTRRRG
jgi:DNA-binding CsgD family transcriptional regulator